MGTLQPTNLMFATEMACIQALFFNDWRHIPEQGGVVHSNEIIDIQIL